MAILTGVTVIFCIYVESVSVTDPATAVYHLGLSCVALNIANYVAPLAGLVGCIILCTTSFSFNSARGDALGHDAEHSVRARAGQLHRWGAVDRVRFAGQRLLRGGERPY